MGFPMLFLRNMMVRVSFLLLTLCSSLMASETILVSVSAYQGLVQELVGPDIQVTSVVPAGADLHTFEPTPRHMQELTKGTIWFTIGEPFEENLRAALPAILTVDLRKGIELIQEEGSSHSSGADPHIWTNPKLMLTQLKTIYEALSSLYPSLEERYRALCRKIVALIEEIDGLLKKAKGSVIVIAHGAYTYLCHEYGIEQLSLEYGEKEPTLAKIQLLLSKAKEHRVKTVFSLKQHSKNGIERVAQLLGGSVVELDPLSPDYINDMKKTAMAIHEAICEQSN